MQLTSLIVAALLSTAQAVKVHVVSVGKNPRTNETALKYFPEKIVAEQGDMVQFQYLAGNHTSTQSSFADPCVRLAASGGKPPGFASGFQPAAASAAKGEVSVMTIMINDTKPIWVFCGQQPHCKKGMAMVINEGNSTLEQYKQKAANSGQGGGNNTGGGNTGGNTGGNNGGSQTTPGDITASPTGTNSPVTSAPVSAGASPAFQVSTTLLLIGAAFMLL
ncbi:extracellular serine-rich protein [Purpureocillium lavendulum]|uniref:Extracellular serine-rich protein n=1 Tax=Purpureocillium lavendulum TaxID=1247861 RepID=A0AB34FSR5_9HYPO|nr:extracellular serine-rich protein [Purpureocillium lavendulum]